MESWRSLVELAWGLGPTQHEDTDNRDLLAGEPERLVEELTVLRCPASRAAREPRPTAPCQTLERLVDLRFGIGDDGIAVGGLVAREAQGIEREGILVRRCPLLLEEAAEDPQFDRIGIHGGSVRCRMGVDLPIRDCYRVADGFLAGAYPASADPEEAGRRLRTFARYGVDVYFDLTHPADPLEPYAQLLGTRARRIPHPIVDFGTTTIPHMIRILDDLDAATGGGHTAYLHCWGGIGRTGTVVGCWLMRHGLDHGDPIAQIAKLRRDVSDARAPSPQTSAQREMVRAWKRGR